MAFKMKHTGGPFGDSCSNYDVILDHEYTVQEFIEEVLREKPEEWGEFDITSDFKYIFTNCIDSCEYKHGEITKELVKQESATMRVKEIKANGGYTLMNYYIKPLEQ